MRLYVGNISRKTSEKDLKELFEGYGAVHSCIVIKDKFSGESKGFGFIDMEDEEAKSAMQALNSSVFQGRPLTVNEARPREERPSNFRNGGSSDFARSNSRNRGYRNDSHNRNSWED